MLICLRLVLPFHCIFEVLHLRLELRRYSVIHCGLWQRVNSFVLLWWLCDIGSSCSIDFRVVGASVNGQLVGPCLSFLALLPRVNKACELIYFIKSGSSNRSALDHGRRLTLGCSWHARILCSSWLMLPYYVDSSSDFVLNGLLLLRLWEDREADWVCNTVRIHTSSSIIAINWKLLTIN